MSQLSARRNRSPRRPRLAPTVLVTAAALLTVSSLPATALPGCLLDDIDSRCERWAAAHSGANHGMQFIDEHARDVAFAPDGAQVVVTGTKSRPASIDEDAWTVAYDAATGAVAWEAREQDGSTTANAVEVTADEVIVAGSVEPDEGAAGFLVAAYDPTDGTRLWRTTHVPPDTGDHVARALAVAGDLVVVVGDGIGPTGKEFVTVALDRATGELLWEAREVGAPGGVVGASRVVVDAAAGRAFVSGALRGDGGMTDMDFVTVAYELGEVGAAERRAWIATYDGGDRGLDVAFDLALSPDGATVFVTGPSEVPDGAPLQPGTATLAYDTTDGSVRWERRHTVTDGSSTGMRVSVAPDGDGVFVIGLQSGTGPTSENGADTDFRVLAYRADDGADEWSATYTGPGYSRDYPFDAALAPDGGQLYVTGLSSVNGHGTDFATVAFDTEDGARAWVARYNSSPAGVDGAVPRTLAVNPDGTALAVTGQFTYLGAVSALVPQDNDRDFGTLLYDL